MSFAIQHLILFVVLFCNFASSLDIDTQTAWIKFKYVSKKNYESADEESRRFAIFEDNLATIVDHNLEEDLGWHSFRQGINHMTDSTLDEFREWYTCLLDDESVNGTSYGEFHYQEPCKVPTSIDYSHLGMVTKVRDQGKCGSCFAMAICGTVEAAWKRAHDKLIDLSAQNLVDCTNTTRYNNGKCAGGHLGPTFQYAIDYGIDTEASYPYTGVDQDCRYRADTVGARIRAYYSVTPYNASALQNVVGCVGPVAVIINSKSQGFRNYKEGIFNDPYCPNTPDHVVLMTGYSTKATSPYWIVKNSWGALWGQRGFIKIAMSGNVCGILNRPVFPTV